MLRLWVRLFGKELSTGFWLIPTRYLCEYFGHLLEWEEIQYVKGPRGICFEFLDDVAISHKWSDIEEEMDRIVEMFGMVAYPPIPNVTDEEWLHLMITCDKKVSRRGSSIYISN